MLSPKIVGVAGTDAMDAYLKGGVDRPAANGFKIAADPSNHLHHHLSAPTSTSTSNTTQAQLSLEHSHHELAPRQEYLRQGWEEIRK